MNELVSIVIRTKDEERWITHCLAGVFKQTYKNVEIILVDNESRDRTIEKARQFPIREVVTCQDYRPGKALNLGIQRTRGAYVACLSGHCIPVNEHWLGNLVRNLEDPVVAAAYGRQEPLAFTADADKRDLLLLFGLDRRVQVKDSFFHNANSALRKSLWEQLPFDETVTNIEDRIWAQEALRRGFSIVYEPEASVYHHHGIHHNGNAERCTNVVRILERLRAEESALRPLDVERLNVVAVIPIRGEALSVNGRPLLAYTIQRARETQAIKRVIVSTDSPELAKLARELGAETPFLRDQGLSGEHVDIASVLRYSLEQIERHGIFPDVVVSLEATFPFRPKALLDEMIAQLVGQGFDSVVAAKLENRGIWKARGDAIVQLDEGLTPRRLKEPTYVELRGLGCVTHPEFLRQGNLFGQKIGIYEVDSPYAHLEVRTEADLPLASRLLEGWFEESHERSVFSHP